MACWAEEGPETCPEAAQGADPSTQPRNGSNWGSCSPALCFGAAAGRGCCQSPAPPQHCWELLPHTSALAQQPQSGRRRVFSAGS